MLLAFRKRWRLGDDNFGMVVLLVALAARMTCWEVGERRSHPVVYFSASRCAATTRRSASEECNLVATSLNTPVRSVWFCEAVLDGMGRMVSYHRRKHTCARLSA